MPRGTFEHTLVRHGRFEFGPDGKGKGQVQDVQADAMVDDFHDSDLFWATIAGELEHC